MEYQKINTIFRRDTNNIIMPNAHYTIPEFEYLKNNIWECTEKIDGCLYYRTPIRMADGTTKLIRDVQAGDRVLGYDTELNTIKEVDVLGVACQKPAGTWVTVKTTRTGLGSGNSFGRIICTHDHRIWTPDRGYIEAYMLKPGDKILNCRSDIKLTPIQEQILVGKMLGDGSLTVKEDSKTASIYFGQKIESYTEWCLQGLQEIAGNKQKEQISGYGTTMYRGRTKSLWSIYDKFNSWLAHGHKEVPEDISLTPISIAFWYMDDGSLEHCDGQEDRVRFATNGFNKESCSYLMRELSKFGISSTLKDYKGNTISLNSENAEKLFLLIFPYICAELKYKLPERYRESPSFIPKESNNQYHKLVVEQEVIEVIRNEEKFYRWDIQTETHNFFTSGGLVHNTNMRVEITVATGIGKPIYNVVYKGRTDKAEIPTHLDVKMHQLFDHIDWYKIFPNLVEGDMVTIYGEGYGYRIQKGGNYIPNDVNFRMFDIKINNWWLKREDYIKIAREIDIETVPFIGYMTIPEAIEYVKRGFKSTIAENRDYDAEGLVLKTPYGLLMRNGQRIITKIKTVDFIKYHNKYGNNSNPIQEENPKYGK